ncbi:MAG: S-layer homology domain-containing protein, partial [Bacillota bacterium]|nr:S-layer homology domain-containing protein [Bacillota bacterium]
VFAKVLTMTGQAETLPDDAQTAAELERFTDAAVVGSWAKQAAALMVSEGLISGFPDGSFKPQEPVTRAQAAMMLLKVLQRIEFIN